MGAPAADPDDLDADLTDLAFWARPPAERMAAFARLREQDRPVFFAEQRVPLVRSGVGFYALVRHSDVAEASRTPRVFSSEPGRDQPRAAAVGPAGLRQAHG